MKKFLRIIIAIMILPLWLFFVLCGTVLLYNAKGLLWLHNGYKNDEVSTKYINDDLKKIWLSLYRRVK